MVVVLHLARSENNNGCSGSGSSRKRGRSPTAAAADPSSSQRGDGRRVILKRPRTGEAPIILGAEPYVPVPMSAIIEDIDGDPIKSVDIFV